MTELKKCPFCGGEAEQDDYTQNEYMFHGTGWIGCKKCRVFIDYKNGDYGKNQAIEAWNRRVNDEHIN